LKHQYDYASNGYAIFVPMAATALLAPAQDQVQDSVQDSVQDKAYDRSALE
jgi:hypothetical protein